MKNGTKGGKVSLSSTTAAAAATANISLRVSSESSAAKAGLKWTDKVGEEYLKYDWSQA